MLAEFGQNLKACSPGRDVDATAFPIVQGACDFRRPLRYVQKGWFTGEADLILISGDFKNSVYSEQTHRRTSRRFHGQVGIARFVSVYRFSRGCERGAEPDPTLWWMKNIDTIYHIDYNVYVAARRG